MRKYLHFLRRNVSRSHVVDPRDTFHFKLMSMFSASSSQSYLKLIIRQSSWSFVPLSLPQLFLTFSTPENQSLPFKQPTFLSVTFSNLLKRKFTKITRKEDIIFRTEFQVQVRTLLIAYFPTY